MSINYSTNGNLALKPYESSPRLTLVNKIIHESNIKGQCIANDLFGYLHDHSMHSDVIATLHGVIKYGFFAGAKERRFAIAASCIACTALFYLSFFAF